MTVPAAISADHRLLCGLSGTEYFRFRARRGGTMGDLLEFVRGQKAFIDRSDPTKSLLSDAFTTSYITVQHSASQTVYCAQPLDASLHAKQNNFLGFHELETSRLNPMPVPLVPHAVTWEATIDGVHEMEANVLAPARR